MSTRKQSQRSQNESTPSRESRATVNKSPLADFGYKVGATGLDKAARQQSLFDFVMEYQIPQRYPEGYRSNWGDPGTSLRLGRTIGQLNLLIDMAKRKKNADMAASIKDWSEDIEFLQQELEESDD